MKNMQKNVRHLSLGKIFISQIMFLLLWTVITNSWGYSQLLGAPAGSWGNHLYNLFSRIVWVVPAIILLQVYKKDIPTTLKKLFSNKPSMRPFLIALAVIILYHFCAMFYTHGGFWINPEFDMSKHLIMFISVAFVEEMVYRGWGLNAFSKYLSERKANLISTLFFVLLHLPAYFIKLYFNGTFPVVAVATQCAFVFVLGLLFGYLYRKGKSLWSPMIVHFLADFLSIMMLG